jgi:SulP family sulfate permease
MFLKPWLVDGFMKYLKMQTYEKHQTVCPQGAKAESMFFVASGMVTAQLEIPGREPIRLITMGSGTVFGEMGLYTMAPRSAAVVTDEPTELYELNDEQLQLMQKEDPEMATALHRFIICLLAERLSQTNSKVQHLT